MDDVLVITLILMGVFWWGYRTGRRRTLDLIMTNLLKDPVAVRQALDKFVEANQAEEEDPTHVPVRVEWVGNICYLYRTDTDEFLAQGTSISQAIERVRDPKIKCIVRKETGTTGQTN